MTLFRLFVRLLKRRSGGVRAPRCGTPPTFKPGLGEAVLEERYVLSTKPVTVLSLGPTLSGPGAVVQTRPMAALMASIKVQSAQGWEVWSPGPNGGGTHTITWSSTGLSGNVKIELTRDGQNWETLSASVPNTGSYVWTVSGPATATAHLRVSSVSVPAVYAISNHDFAIIGPYYHRIPGGECTELAARSFDQVPGSPKVSWLGDAGTWYSGAAATCKETTDPNKATVGAIGVWSNGGFGHVAVVSALTRDKLGHVTQVTFREQNWGATRLDKYWAITDQFGKPSTVTLSASKLQRSSFAFVGFILPQAK